MVLIPPLLIGTDAGGSLRRDMRQEVNQKAYVHDSCWLVHHSTNCCIISSHLNRQDLSLDHQSIR